MTAYENHPTIIPAENDGMSKQVATELLCDPLARLTAATRNAAIRARCNYFTTNQLRKPPEEKLVRKVREAAIHQVYKWLKRAITRRIDCQRAYVRVLGTTPAHDKLRAALELKAAACDIMCDVCETEIKDREANRKAYADRKTKSKAG